VIVSRERFLPDVTALPGVRHEHAHATNVIRDAFGPADGLPFVSVVDRLPQTAAPVAVHAHRGWSELIVMMQGRVVVWCGASPAEIRPYRLVPGSMFLIPASHCHVFVNGNEAARWMILFAPEAGTPPAATREEISRGATERGIPIPAARLDEVRRSLLDLDARAEPR
jgi:mannose-6-phosphate isomerase-like protein (cupin superfamily)